MPELEEETALANIALDLLGQARMLLARAGGILGRTEDQLAFFRDEHEFRNVRLVERRRRRLRRARRPAAGVQLPGGSRCSRNSCTRPDPVLAAIAAKGVKELTYHRDYAAQWVVRLGDGTELSHAAHAGRARHVVAAGRRAVPAGRRLALPLVEREAVDAVLDTVLATGGLDRPTATPLAGVGGRYGRDGVHTEAMGYVLAELQSVARAVPGRDVVSATLSRVRRRRRHAGPELPMVTLADLGILRSVDVTTGGTVVATITPDLLRLPGHARDQRRPPPPARARRLRRRRGPHPAGAGVDHRLDHRRRAAPSSRPPASRRRRPHRAATGPVPLTLGAPPAVRVPALRLDPTPPHRGVQRDGLQGAAPLRRVRRAVRGGQGPMTLTRTDFHPLRVERVDRLTDDSAAVTFAVPDELADGVRLRARPVADRAARRRAALLLDLRPGGRRAAHRRARGRRRRRVELAGATSCGPATPSRCRRRAGRSPPTSRHRRTTC